MKKGFDGMSYDEVASTGDSADTSDTVGADVHKCRGQLPRWKN